LACLLFPALARAQANPSGLLFYAGFDTGYDAGVSLGNGKASFTKGQPPLAEGFRGLAARCGFAEGNLQYEVAGNLNAAEGSIEMCVCPVNWDSADSHHHIFFKAMDPSWIQLYRYSASRALLLLTATEKAPYTCAQNYLGAEMKQGRWDHLLATWKDGETRVYVNGKEKPAYARQVNPHLPRKLTGKFTVGDIAFDEVVSFSTMIDEVYIYGRALSEAEAQWAYKASKTRRPGEDIPAGIEPVVRRMTWDADLGSRTIVVEAELNPRYAGQDYDAALRIEVAQTNAKDNPPVPALRKNRTFTGRIPYASLQKGPCALVLELKDANSGKVAATVKQPFEYPGDGREWQGNHIGILDVPPEPWKPIEPAPSGFRCWGREYGLDGGSLLRRVVSRGEELLARPVRLAARARGREVIWKPKTWTQLSENANSITWIGSSDSEIGVLEWRVTAEFDGFIRYDVQIHPLAAAQVDSLELRFPVKPERAAYYYADSNFSAFNKWGELRGLTPSKKGAFVSADFAVYCHLGDDDRGLQVSIPSDEPWQEVDRQGMIRLERTDNSVDIVWAFCEKPWTLPRPWKLSFAVQATPVKDSAGWRKWRFSRQGEATLRTLPEYKKTDRESGTYYVYMSNWGLVDGNVPLAENPKDFRAAADRRHAQGHKCVQYFLPDYTSETMPMWKFRMKQYYNLEHDGSWYAVYPSKDWADWQTWMLDTFLRTYDQDGLYWDNCWVKSTGGRYGKTSDLVWYQRDGVRRKVYALFETRDLLKRLYTMLKTYGKDTNRPTWLIIHAGTMPLMAVHGFGDAAFQGEDIKDNYEKTLPLDLLRIRGQSASLGIGAYWIPQRQHFEPNRLEQSRILLGRLLLHDVQPWNVYIDENLIFELFEAQNRFGGIVDADFLPYWSNAAQIAGQTDEVKASAYRKPAKDGGALVTATNLSGVDQRVTLTLDPAALHAGAQPKVRQMMKLGKVEAGGVKVTVTIPKHECVVFEVK